MKTEKELSILKDEFETLNKKLAELNEDELKEVTGGVKIVGIKPTDESSEKSNKNGFIPIPY